MSRRKGIIPAGSHGTGRYPITLIIFQSCRNGGD